MIRSLAAMLVLAAGWSFNDLSWERLRWNPRERTAAGIEVLDTEKKQGAIEAFETAARLDSGNPVLRFNAGSAHLLAGTEGAIQHLELAAETAPDDLRAAANYNLGNARLGAGDTAGAIASYEQTLRLAPDHQDAKFNLELALQQQQQQEQEQQENQGDKSQDQQDQKDQDNQDQSQEQQQPSPDQQDDEQEPDSGQNQQQEPDPGDGNQQLPQFEEQPDMTAEQAAAILESVENLEREQRRKQAEQELKKRSHKGKDW